MLDPAILERVDSYWAADFFGCSLDEYHSTYHVQKHAGKLQQDDYCGIYCFSSADRTTISIPPRWFDRVGPMLPASPDELANGLRSIATAIVGPAYIGYSNGGSASHGDARAVRQADKVAWTELQAACLPIEWDHGGSNLDEACSGVFSGERLIALAGYKTWGGIIAHISIVTHPDFRGHGHGRSAVAHAMNQAVSDGLIPQYQTLDSNGPSIALASALGFSRYARSLAIRLPTEVQGDAHQHTMTG